MLDWIELCKERGQGLIDPQGKVLSLKYTISPNFFGHFSCPDMCNTKPIVLPITFIHKESIEWWFEHHFF